MRIADIKRLTFKQLNEIIGHAVNQKTGEIVWEYEGEELEAESLKERFFRVHKSRGFKDAEVQQLWIEDRERYDLKLTMEQEWIIKNEDAIRKYTTELEKNRKLNKDQRDRLVAEFRIKTIDKSAILIEEKVRALYYQQVTRRAGKGRMI